MGTVRSWMRIIGLGLGAFAIGAQVWRARGLVETHRIWRDGATATAVVVGPRGERSDGFFDAGREHLSVAYTDRNGTRHSVKFEIWALNTPIDDRLPATVKYAPGAPKRAALSWLQDIEGARWGDLAFMTGLALLVMVLSFRLVRPP